MYQGSVQEAKEYFDGMGRNCPSNTNPADYYMDVIGGIRKEGDDCVDLFDEWSVHANRRRDGNVCNVDILQDNAGISMGNSLEFLSINFRYIQRRRNRGECKGHVSGHFS